MGTEFMEERKAGREVKGLPSGSGREGAACGGAMSSMRLERRKTKETGSQPISWGAQALFGWEEGYRRIWQLDPARLALSKLETGIRTAAITCRRKCRA
jgi:hypothetical protein